MIRGGGEVPREMAEVSPSAAVESEDATFSMALSVTSIGITVGGFLAACC